MGSVPHHRRGVAAVRGVFVSLGALLLIGILLISMIAGRERAEEQTRIELDYLQNRLAKEYLEVLEKATIPREIAYQAKGSLSNLPPSSSSSLSDDIEGLVKAQVNKEHGELGLPLALELHDVRITDWSQSDPWTIQLDYAYEYTARSSPGIDWDVAGAGAVNISVIGFEHPDYSAFEPVTRSFYGINKTPGSSGCILRSIDSSYGCPSDSQICPFTYEECRP